MSARSVSIVIVAAALALLGTLTSLFSVNERDFAIRTEFGAIVATGYRPGLHWKLPWDQVVKLDRRTLMQSNPMQAFITKDNRSLIIDSYIEWRIANPTVYYETTGGSEKSAGERISDIVTDGMKSDVAQRTLEQVVTADRAAVTDETLASASRAVSALGIQLVDVRVQSIELPDEVADRVYEDMKEDFAKTANRLRAEGESAATAIRATADRNHTEIISNAQRAALEIKGAADAEAADTYARAYSADPEFYAFYRSLQAYERALGKSNGVLVLSPDSEFFRYLRNPARASH